MGSWAIVNAQDASSPDEQFALAAGHYERGELDEAIDGWNRLIRRYPGHAAAQLAPFWLGEAHVQRHQYEQAYLAFQSFLTQLPNHDYAARARFRMAESAMHLGRTDQAASLFEVFTRNYPGHPLQEYALPYLGQMRLERDEPQLAQRAFELALRYHPRSSLSNQSRVGLARALIDQGALEEGIRFYEFVIRQDDPRWSGVAHLELGKIDFQQRRWSEAESEFTMALEGIGDPSGRAEAGYWLARCSMERGDYQQATNRFAAVADLDAPAALRAAILMDGAAAAVRAESPQMADEWLRQLISEQPESDWTAKATCTRIELAFRQGELDRTLELTRNFTRQHPDTDPWVRVREIEGRVLYQQHKYTEALRVFDDLVRRSEAGPEVTDSAPTWRYLRALCLVELDRHAEAATALNEIETDPQQVELQTAIDLALATSLIRIGNHQAAIEPLQRYLANHPAEPAAAKAWADLALAFARTGQWKRADAAADDLWTLRNQGDFVAATLVVMGELAMGDQRPDWAGPWFERALKQPLDEPTKIRALAGLAWSLFDQGRREESSQRFDQLIRDYPDRPVAVEAALARAQELEQRGLAREASAMYSIVLQSPAQERWKDVARVRRAYLLLPSRDPEDVQEAIELLTKVDDLGKDSALRGEAVYLLGWAADRQGDQVDAEHHFERLLAEFPDSPYGADAAYRLAVFAWKNGRWSRVDEIAESLQNRDVPDALRSRVEFLVGQAAAKRSLWEATARAMKRVIEADPDGTLSDQARYWLAESAYQQNEFVQAGEIFSILLQRIDRFEAKLAPWILVRSAQCAAQQKHWPEAEKWARQGLAQYAQFDNRFEFHFLLGRALVDKGKLDDARQAFQQVIASQTARHTPTAAMAEWWIGETYFHQQRYAQAIAAYYRVDSLYQSPRWRAAALLQAGKCQEHLGNWKHAIRLYQQLIEKYPTSPYRDQAEGRLKIATRQAKRLGPEHVK